MALLAEYAVHLERSPLAGHTPRTCLGAVRVYLAWLQAGGADGDPLNDATLEQRAYQTRSGPANPPSPCCAVSPPPGTPMCT